MNKKTMNQLQKKINFQFLRHSSLCGLTSILLLMLAINIMAADSILSSSIVSNSKDYKITSPVSGVIKQVFVTTGKTVKKGDILLEFDNTLIAGNLSEAKVNLKLAKLNRAEAKKELERAEELYDRTVLSEHDLQQAKVLYAKAQAQYASAENQLVHAQWDIKHSKLYATFTGRVSQVFAYPGQYVNNQFSAQPLLLIKADSLK